MENLYPQSTHDKTTLESCPLGAAAGWERSRERERSWMKGPLNGALA